MPKLQLLVWQNVDELTELFFTRLGFDLIYTRKQFKIFKILSCFIVEITKLFNKLVMVWFWFLITPLLRKGIRIENQPPNVDSSIPILQSRNDNRLNVVIRPTAAIAIYFTLVTGSNAVAYNLSLSHNWAVALT